MLPLALSQPDETCGIFTLHAPIPPCRRGVHSNVLFFRTAGSICSNALCRHSWKALAAPIDPRLGTAIWWAEFAAADRRRPAGCRDLLHPVLQTRSGVSQCLEGDWSAPERPLLCAGDGALQALRLFPYPCDHARKKHNVSSSLQHGFEGDFPHSMSYAGARGGASWMLPGMLPHTACELGGVQWKLLSCQPVMTRCGCF